MKNQNSQKFKFYIIIISFLSGIILIVKLYVTLSSDSNSQIQSIKFKIKDSKPKSESESTRNNLPKVPTQNSSPFNFQKNYLTKNTSKTLKLIDFDSQNFPSYNIAKTRKSEIDFCLFTPSPKNTCFSDAKFKTEPFLDIGWNLIPENEFLANLKDLKSHTSAKHTTVIQIEAENSCDLEFRIIAKNYRDQPKKYGGDLFNARLLPSLKPKEEIYSTAIPGHIQDNNDGTYNVLFPKMVQGAYFVVINLMKSSEEITAIIRMTNGINRFTWKSRQVLEFEDGTNFTSNYCGPIIPEMLIGAPKSLSYFNLTEYRGLEWFCQNNSGRSAQNEKPKIIWNGADASDYDKENKELYISYQNPEISKISSKYGFNRANESLVHKTQVNFPRSTVLKYLDCPTIDDRRSKIDQIFKKYKYLPGYWKNDHWIDRIFEHYEGNTDDGGYSKMNLKSIMTDKRIVILGDSFANLIRRDIKERLKLEFRVRVKPYTSYDFLQLKKDYYSDQCTRAQDWGANKFRFPTINSEIYLVTHGSPTNKFKCSGALIYSVEIIKRMIRNRWFGSNYVIVMTHGPHFSTWHPTVFYNRLIAIRNTVIEYKKAEQIYLAKKSMDLNQTATFIYKTPSYVRGDLVMLYATVSGYQMYRMREISFKIFGNPYVDENFHKMMRSRKIEDELEFPVKVYDTYAPSFLVYDKYLHVGNVHPQGMLQRFLLRGILRTLWARDA